jgi:hypothetical protein
MRDVRSHPAVFHRVFLSHLLVVLLCFAAAVILVDYMFAEGIALFLLRSPIILIPALLALIGIVGLLALWTAGSVAIPLDRAASLLREHEASERLGEILPKAGTEEVARLLINMQQRLARDTAGCLPRPLVLRIDAHLNVHGCDIDTAARLGYTPDELRRLNLRDLLADTAGWRTVRSTIGALHAEDTGAPVSCDFRAAAGRTIHASCMLHTLPDEQYLLIGMMEKPI